MDIPLCPKCKANGLMLHHDGHLICRDCKILIYLRDCYGTSFDFNLFLSSDLVAYLRRRWDLYSEKPK